MTVTARVLGAIVVTGIAFGQTKPSVAIAGADSTGVKVQVDSAAVTFRLLIQATDNRGQQGLRVAVNPGTVGYTPEALSPFLKRWWTIAAQAV